MIRHMKWLKIFLLLALTLVLNVQSFAQNWQNGERLYYKISFGIFTIGEAELLYEQKEDSTYKIIGRAWDTAPFFTIRDRWYAQGTHKTHPFLTKVYTQNQIENDYKAHKKVVYKHEKGEAISQNIYANLPKKRINISENTRDYLSALYNMRKNVQKPKVKDELSYNVMGFDKTYVLKTKITAQKTVQTAIGKKTILKIQPTLHKVGEEKAPQNKWEIWITDDAQRLPVKIIAKLKFGGSFTANLQSIGTVKSASHAPEGLPEKGAITLPIKKQVAAAIANPMND